MKIQVIGLGNVGKGLLQLMIKEKEKISKSLDIKIVTLSDSNGTIINEDGIDIKKILKYKNNNWLNYSKYLKDYSGLDSIKYVKSDIVVELTPSTVNGEPGLSHIKESLRLGKNVVTANKSPLVMAYDELTKLAESNNVKLLFEATVGAHLPIFCLLRSCYGIDQIVSVKGILNSTTNYVIGEIENGKTFEGALDEAIRSGWAETDYSDDVDGIDAARKLVILSNFILGKNSRLDNVRTIGIRNIENLISEAKTQRKKVKLLCELEYDSKNVDLSVSPQTIDLDDPLATVNQGNMGISLMFQNLGEVFISVKYNSPLQTAYAVLNDIISIQKCD